jgi:large subunit ribosomal protein L3
MKFILGKKLGMSQIFDSNGKVIPVTLIEAGPCYVTQIKIKDKDKYEAIQIGYLEKTKKIKKTEQKKPFKYLREFKGDLDQYQVGDKIDVSIFQEGERVKISGISKGKGFQGAVKRWGFAGRGSSHGVKHEHRTIGSVGCRFPQRVVKGRKMPGRMGSERVTISNLQIVKIDKQNNLLAVKGAVPGNRGSLLEIKGK